MSAGHLRESLTLTVAEAAKLVRVNRKTFYIAVQEGKVPGVVRIGRSIRISRQALLEWLSGSQSCVSPKHAR